MAEKPTYQDLERRIQELERALFVPKESGQILEKTITPSSRPLIGLEEIDFKALFSLEEIQTLQDQFADATGVASIITEPDGTPITSPSNFCRLCKEIIRKTDRGRRDCFKSDALMGRHNPAGPIIQPCMGGGLWDAGAGITVGGKHVANWLIGQVRDDNSQAEDDIIHYARKIGVDETEMLAAFREVPSMPRHQFEKIAQMLFTLANQLSSMAYQNRQQAHVIAEREKVESEILKSEARYRALIESSTDFIWETDAHGIYTYVSPSIHNILGRSPESVVGQTPFDLMAPDEADRIRGIFLATIEQRGSFNNLVNVNLHKDGHERVMETSGVPVFDASGGFKGFRGIDRDITDKHFLELEVKRSAVTLKSIFRASPIGIGMVTDRIITWGNDHFLEMLGYTPAEIIGQNSRILYPDQEEFERVGREKYHQIAQRGTGSVETKWTMKNGRIIDVFLSSTPLDQSDLFKGVTFTAMDITDRKNNEKALRESEERFRFAFFTSPDAITLNRLSDGTYLDVNRGFTRLLGYTRKEVIGQSSIALNIWKDLAERSFLTNALTREKNIENRETQFVCKDGQIKVALMSASIMQLAGEDVILAVTRDITERKRIENELEEYRKHLEDLVKKRTEELEAKNKELEVFTYSVSHDLKAPLRGIDGYSRLLVEDYGDRLDEEGLLFLNNVRHGTAQMNQLIEDLLSYSRMERKEIQAISIDLDSVIDILLSQREHEIETRRIKISVTLPFTTIHADSETLRQVLGNYLDNAIKFLNPEIPGRVTVGGTEDQGSWTLWVRDNGIGFDPQYHDRIFDIFQRLHRAEDYPGTGIGLAIVRKAVERINGRVWAETALGEGSTFYVSIPKINDLI